MSNIVYSFENVEIKDFELDCINVGRWIKDVILHLAGRKIEIEANKNKKGPRDPVLFIPPDSVEFFIQFPLELCIDSRQYFDVFNSDLVFIPFTDSVGKYHCETHWALLVWRPGKSNKDHQIFEYLDSSGFANEEEAFKVAKKFSMIYEAPDYEIIPRETPQQTNSYDCGMFVMAYIKHYAKYGSIEGIFDTVSQEIVSENRKTYIQDYMPDK